MKVLFSYIALIITGFCTYFAAEKGKVYTPKYQLVENAPLVGLKTEAIDVLTLGHRGLYDDFIDIWLLQILMDPALKKESPDKIYKTILDILKQKPKIESSYMLPCFVLMVDFARPDLCENITILGLEAFPQSWRIPMTQGYVYAFKLNDPIKASAFYNLAASRKNSPPYVQSLAQKMLLKGGNDQETMKETLDLMLQVEGGSKFAEFVANTIKNKAKEVDDANNSK